MNLQAEEKSSCGVGFIVEKHSRQGRKILDYGKEALERVPHRGGFNAEGTGDGAGVCVDLPLAFFSEITGESLNLGEFAVGNFFIPQDVSKQDAALQFIRDFLSASDLAIFFERLVPTDETVLNQASCAAQLPIWQFFVRRPKQIQNEAEFEELLTSIVLQFDRLQCKDIYCLSFCARKMVLKGRLNSWEVLPYFSDFADPHFAVSLFYFHTRFSTNTEPNPFYAQPFRFLAHNGEINTDRKNRLAEIAQSCSRGENLTFPAEMSDSARFDFSLAQKLLQEKVFRAEKTIEEIVLALMPPAFEHSSDLSDVARAFLNYNEQYSEKNDGPAAVIFSDGKKIAARLDRLGLRPLRTVETDNFFAVFSESGQSDFQAEKLRKLGRIAAGEMIVFDRETGRITTNAEVLARAAERENFALKLAEQSYELKNFSEERIFTADISLSRARLNADSLRFFLDPMLECAAERLSAMGYGAAINPLNPDEAGMSRYFSQKFAQVTNPPLDSIREGQAMSLTGWLGAKFDAVYPLIRLQSPLLFQRAFEQIKERAAQGKTKIACFESVFTVDKNDEINAENLRQALDDIADKAVNAVKSGAEIVIFDDLEISKTSTQAHDQARISPVLVIAALNQALIRNGLREKCSLIAATTEAVSSQDFALLLSLGASAILPYSVMHRARELADGDIGKYQKYLANYRRALEKMLLKTMAKFGVCTLASYIGGEFFEANFLDTEDEMLAKIFPNIRSAIGGVDFVEIARIHRESWTDKHTELANLGLFKERRETKIAHSFGAVAVANFAAMTREVDKQNLSDEAEILHLLPQDDEYLQDSFQPKSAEIINKHQISAAYRKFSAEMAEIRAEKPSALRDLLSFPFDFSSCRGRDEFLTVLNRIYLPTDKAIFVRGLSVKHCEDAVYLQLADVLQVENLIAALQEKFALEIEKSQHGEIRINPQDEIARNFCRNLRAAPASLPINQVEGASEITKKFATGAMSQGALLEKAHIAVAMGINMVGGLSNCGEGGESSRRFGTIRASKIKQIASGRFGVWAAYLADPNLEELEIKIAQGAKPGEGGQLPAGKVTVEIAAARGATPGIELVSPPPHHDTYSIEDLAQLIHDCKAAGKRVAVKLVSTVGIGTIAVGVVKAGADTVNIAGNTGGTGAAAVTSLKYAGRAAELAISEVHQALVKNNLREKVRIRASNAHQTASDIIKTAMLGADEFEFGTTALMMLKCVMAKNCNLKCPVGITTPHEAFDGDPRALAHYFLNLACEVREILAALGFRSLREIRGRADLLHLIKHRNLRGNFRLAEFLSDFSVSKNYCAQTLNADYSLDEKIWDQFLIACSQGKNFQFEAGKIDNRVKSFGGRIAVKLEKFLNYEKHHRSAQVLKVARTGQKGDFRFVLNEDAIKITTSGSAGQSYGAFCNSGMFLEHTGVANDGVGKSICGGKIAIFIDDDIAERVLVGNFAGFGATGGEMFIAGAAGDRFAVRNSGLVAIVEGVGDFACEYMTAGCVVNLGGYGKNFGAGMTGGVAFQYAKEEITVAKELEKIRLDGKNELDAAMSEVLREILLRHARYTHSDKAIKIIENFAEEKENFYCLIPKAWIARHLPQKIAEISDTTELKTEIAAAFAAHLMRQMRRQLVGEFLAEGAVPDEFPSLLADKIIISAAVREMAIKVLKNRGADRIENALQKIFMNDDREILRLLQDEIEVVLEQYQERELATIAAFQRLNDFRRSLVLRENFDRREQATAAWIMFAAAICEKERKNFPTIERLLARKMSRYLQRI